MLHSRLFVRLSLSLLFVGALSVTAFAQTPPSYGTPITLAQARKVVAAAEAEATKNKWNVVIAVVDTGGNLVLLERMDDTQIFSIEIAQKKARTANGMRRPSKVFDDMIAGGGAGIRILGIDQLAPIEGGIPLMIEGKIVGAIGVSGVTSQQDGQIAAAGVAALK
ncbi:MAG: heme-binding protein [Acidobacteriota bacterium]|nr:heme-binding protein [Acidobacteriota bacterium]